MAQLPAAQLSDASTSSKAVPSSQDLDYPKQPRGSRPKSRLNRLSTQASRSISRSKSKSKNISKPIVHSTNVHEKSVTTNESKQQDYNYPDHPFIDLKIVIPSNLPTDTKMAQWTAEKESLKSTDIRRSNKLCEILQLQRKRVEMDLVFESKEKNKMITQGDICHNFLNARHVKGWLKASTIKIDDLKSSGESKIYQFIMNRIYKVYFYLLSKQEIEKMPQWCKTNTTVAGTYSVYLHSINIE